MSNIKPAIFDLDENDDLFKYRISTGKVYHNKGNRENENYSSVEIPSIWGDKVRLRISFYKDGAISCSVLQPCEDDPNSEEYTLHCFFDKEQISMFKNLIK